MSGEGTEVPTESGEPGKNVDPGASTSSSTTTIASGRRPKREPNTRHAGRYFRNQVQGRLGTPIVRTPVPRGGHIRPRSLFTARTDDYHLENSFHQSSYSRPSSKFYANDVIPVDWDNVQSNAVSAASATVVDGTTVYSPNGIFSPGEPHQDGLHIPAIMNTKAQALYAAVQNIMEFGLINPKNCYNCRGEPVDDNCMGALVTGDGMITVRLNHGVRVDITAARAIRIQNNPGGIIMALNAIGSTAAVIHPSGKVYQYGSRVEIATSDPRGNSNYAKMWHKGVSFSSEACALVYLVDTAGTRTTTDSFSDLNGDFSVPIFLENSIFGPSTIQECMAHLHSLQYWITEEGIENWVINGVRISQTTDGMVRVGKTQSKHNMRTSPFNGTASMSTPYVHCTASVGNACHLFVKRGERRMHYDGSSFIVRNAGHSAGFDDNHKLKVY